MGSNGNGVLKMRRGFSIGGDHGPAVFEDFDLVRSQIDHRLDGKNEPGLDFRARAVLDIIQDWRVFVKRAADAVAAEFAHNSIVVRVCESLNRR